MLFSRKNKMIMANNNNKDKCNVPHLRFPEFSGEWKKV